MKAVLGSLFTISRNFNYFPFSYLAVRIPFFDLCLFCTGISTPESETPNQESVIQGVSSKFEDTVVVFRRWGCNDSDILKIFRRQPSIRNLDICDLQSKLNIMCGLGITSSDLVKIINCRPRFLSYRISDCLDQRLGYLQSFFGCREMLLQAILRNPSLLTYDVHLKIKPVIALYEGMGLCKKDLIYMFLSRPTLIRRTSLNDEKLDYICRTGVSKDSKMYIHVVTLFAISRLDTIREKLANLEKFGFSDDEVLQLIGRSPLLLTLSIDKVQRNMTFVLGTMKLPSMIVLDKPFLLFLNLETVLKPRVLLARRIQELGFVPQIEGPVLFRALRMIEKHFLKVFVQCHRKDVADGLMDYYTNVKGVKRLAESSKKNLNKLFPF